MDWILKTCGNLWNQVWKKGGDVDLWGNYWGRVDVYLILWKFLDVVEIFRTSIQVYKIKVFLVYV